jgi:hypothetical protein
MRITALPKRAGRYNHVNSTRGVEEGRMGQLAEFKMNDTARSS